MGDLGSMLQDALAEHQVVVNIPESKEDFCRQLGAHLRDAASQGWDRLQVTFVIGLVHAKLLDCRSKVMSPTA